MSQSIAPPKLDDKTLSSVQAYDLQQRLNYLVEEANKYKEIWILTDEHGCMMLNSDDEDCVPIWPHQQFAQTWITGEWENCKAVAISLDKWFSSWTSGLEEDELALAIFPSNNDEGLVLFPDEFEFELKKQAKK